MAPLLVVLLVCLFQVTISQESCYAEDPNPYLNFSTKTSYGFVYNKEGISPIQGCKPIQIWLVSRHGTRWPLKHNLIWDVEALEKIRDQVLANYQKNKTSLCREDVYNLQSWQMVLDKDVAGMLTAQGRQELYLLGRRVRSFFPDILNSTVYSPDKYVFRSTKSQRTEESSEYFARGVLGMEFQDATDPLPVPLSDDQILKPYKNCPVWNNLPWRGTEESARFNQSEFMTDVVHSVSRRLGLDYNISQANLAAMYNTCRYQKAWNVSGISPWCSAFSKQELKVMEYSDDVGDYYDCGPGSPDNLRLGCPLLKDMINHFSEVEDHPEGSNPLAVFYFMHDTMLEMFFSRMGLVNDSDPLTADNFLNQQSRQFRTSRLMPFASNFIAVLQNCTGGQLKTAFYLTEAPLQFPGCPEGVCDWHAFKQNFSTIVQDSACSDFSWCFSSGISLTNGNVATFIFISVNLFVNKVWQV